MIKRALVTFSLISDRLGAISKDDFSTSAACGLGGGDELGTWIGPFDSPPVGSY